MRPALLAASLGLGLVGMPTSPAHEAFRVIVHRSNPISSLNKSQVSDLFLKRMTEWPHASPVRVVDQAADSPVRTEFSREILRRPVSAVEAYWQQKIFSGRGVPPPQKASDLEVVAYVEANPEAIGYVSASARLGRTKTLQIQE
jgi:ABC-type phosphate transport system substrate-binding protein